MNTPIEQRYYDLRQAAIYLGLSRKTLYKWAELGTMPAHKVGRVWRFDREELDGFVHHSTPSSPACIIPPSAVGIAPHPIFPGGGAFVQ